MTVDSTTSTATTASPHPPQTAPQLHSAPGHQRVPAMETGSVEMFTYIQADSSTTPPPLPSPPPQPARSVARYALPPPTHPSFTILQTVVVAALLCVPWWRPMRVHAPLPVYPSTRPISFFFFFLNSECKLLNGLLYCVFFLHNEHFVCLFFYSISHCYVTTWSCNLQLFPLSACFCSFSSFLSLLLAL